MTPDPYGRPILTYTRDRQAVIAGDVPGWRGTFTVGERSWHGIENATARPVPAGQCHGLVRMRGDGSAPCIWLFWGDPDGGEEHQIHVANTPDELKGCIAPGSVVSVSGVLSSRVALGEMFAALVNAATYGEWVSDDGARVDYYNPPLGLVVVVHIVETAPAVTPEPASPSLPPRAPFRRG